MKVETIVIGVLQNNVYLVFDEKSKEALIIDPSSDSGKIYDALLKSGCRLKYIALTHGHYDHVNGVLSLAEKTGAKIIAHKDDVDLLNGNVSRLGAKDKIYPDIFVSDGDVFYIGDTEFKILHTPGHSKGGVCYITSGAIFSGDTLFQLNIGRCDLYDGDYQAMLESLKKLKNTITQDLKVYPGHGDATSFLFEKENNPYMKQV